MRRRPLLYLDVSAIVKLVLVEPESVALRTVATTARIAASELVVVEVARALGRVPANQSERARVRREEQRVLAGLDLVALTRPLLTSAGRLASPRLRSLDAVHVASALTFGTGVASFVSYDRRQLDAAADVGLTLESGRSRGQVGTAPPP